MEGGGKLTTLQAGPGMGTLRVPGQSDRAIAEQVGVGAPMVGKYRCNNITPEPAANRIGRDGKSYPPTQPARSPSPATKDVLVVDSNTGAIIDRR